jgi:pimeloyl-ACP methyl ester carboxylesterase
MSDLLGLLLLLGIAAAALVGLLTVILVRGARNPPRHTAAHAIARGRPCDPGDLGLACDAWWLERPRGTRLPVWEIAGRGPAGSPTVVMLHGWGQSRVDMLVRLEPWIDLASRLVVFDGRGHGEAEGGPSRLGDGEDDDLRALLERLDADRPVLVGRSMGAVIAIHAAARVLAERPDAIAGVVAYAAYADLHDSLRARLRLMGMPVRPMTDLAMAWLRLRGVRPRPVLDVAAGLTCPLLVIQGADDLVAPVEHGAALVRAAPDATLLRVEGAAHGNVREADEAGHDEAVRAFMARVGSA